MTAKTQAQQQGWLLLGHDIAGQVRQAGEVWKAVALAMCDSLPPGDDVDREDIVLAVEYVKQGAEEAGELLAASRLRSVLLTGRRNYEYLTRPYPSWTAMEECGDHPDRFSWYEQYGKALTKRKARELNGKRKLDGPNAAMDELLRLMDEGDEEAVVAFLVRHPNIRSLYERIANKTHALDEDARDAISDFPRDPEWDNADRLVATMARAEREIRVRLKAVAENMGTSTPRTRVVNAAARLTDLLGMVAPLMEGVDSVEAFLSNHDTTEEH